MMGGTIMSKRVWLKGLLVVTALVLLAPLAAFGTPKLIVNNSSGGTGFVVTDDPLVGIGTANPTSLLHVSGGFVTVDNAGVPALNPGLSMRNTAATFPAGFAVGGVGNPNLLANWNLVNGTQYDTTKISYGIGLQVNNDQITFMRAPAGGSFVTFVTLKGATSSVGIGTTNPTSKLQVVGLPNYANNAAAIAGGLTVGAFYWGCNGDAVCVVH
jgi:hypothetical protein